MTLRLIIVNASHMDECRKIENLLKKYFSAHSEKNSGISLITGNNEAVIQKISQQFKDYIYNYDEFLTLEFINKFCVRYDEIISLNSQELAYTGVDHCVSMISLGK